MGLCLFLDWCLTNRAVSRDTQLHQNSHLGLPGLSRFAWLHRHVIGALPLLSVLSQPADLGLIHGAHSDLLLQLPGLARNSIIPDRAHVRDHTRLDPHDHDRARNHLLHARPCHDHSPYWSWGLARPLAWKF